MQETFFSVDKLCFFCVFNFLLYDLSTYNFPQIISMSSKLYPKIELHAHLSGSLSNNVTSKLLKTKEEFVSKETLKSMQSTLTLGNKRTLAECFEIFKMVHLLTNSLDSIRMITYEVIKDFNEDNVWYLELRTTPKAISNVYTKQQYLEAVLETVINTEKEMKIMVRILVSIDRSRGVEDGWDTLKVVKDLLNNEIYKKYICGIDISGNPNVGTLIEYLALLQESRNLGLKNAVHLLEVAESSAQIEAEKVIKEGLVDRIGHGTFLHPKSKGSVSLSNTVRNSKIPIEICITSNLKCGVVDDLASHHVKHWHMENHPIAICTDDKGVFSTTLSEELDLFCKAVDGNSQDVKNVILTSLDASFLEEEKKKELREEIKSKFNELLLI